MKALATRQVTVRIAAIIISIELLIMLVLATVPHEPNAYLVALIDVAVLSLMSTPIIYVLVIKPFVTARNEALAQVTRLANIDALTQLPNRRLLSKNLERDIAGSVRHDYHAGLLLIDLDGFKRVNDTHGHDAGDAVLVETADRLQSITRSEDAVGRLGGDEFVVLVNHLDGDQRIAHERALQIAEKLIDELSEPIDAKGKSLHIGASIGIRLLGSEKLDTETALKEADTAMYRAKEKGGGCAVPFEECNGTNDIGSGTELERN